MMCERGDGCLGLSVAYEKVPIRQEMR